MSQEANRLVDIISEEAELGSLMAFEEPRLLVRLSILCTTMIPPTL